MKRTIGLVLAILIVASMLVSCATPAAPAAPQVVTQIVEKEVKVVETQLVEKEVKVVETQVVEKAVSQDRTKVTFWHIFGSGPSRDVFDNLISEFNLENPQYIVEPVYTDFWTYDQKFLAAVAAGDPPDVIMADQTRAGQRAEAKQVIALDPYIQADDYDMSVFWEYPQKDVQWQGEIWGIPFGPDTRVLFYNKDMFTEAGLDPEKPPTTWDELFQYAQQLDKKNDAGELTQVGFNPWWGNVWVMPFVYTTGAEVVDEAGKVTINSPEVLEAATWYKEWVDHYGKENLDNFASSFGSGAQDPFISGQVAMIIQVQSFIGDLQEFAPDMNWGVAQVPYLNQPASWGAGFDLEIPTGAKNPDGAWAFIKYMTEKDTQVQFAVASGWMPSRVDAAQDPQLASTPGWDVVLESMKVTQSRKFVLEVPTGDGPLTTAFQEVWDGVKTPEQALNDAQAAVDQEIENFLATH
jgi:multiple sugar transport system substrate-binding protein